MEFINQLITGGPHIVGQFIYIYILYRCGKPWKTRPENQTPPT
jgi:hypothetical protein